MTETSSKDIEAEIDKFSDEIMRIYHEKESDILKIEEQLNKEIQKWEQLLKPIKTELNFNRKVVYEQKMNSIRLQARYNELAKLKFIERKKNSCYVKKLNEKCRENSFLQSKAEMKSNAVIKKCGDICKELSIKEQSINEAFAENHCGRKVNELRDEIIGLVEVEKSLSPLIEKEQQLTSHCKRVEENIKNITNDIEKLKESERIKTEERDKLLVTLKSMAMC